MQDIFCAVKDTFPAIREWKYTLDSSDGERGVQTLLGRTRPLRDLDSQKGHRRRHAERAAVNTPVQGSTLPERNMHVVLFVFSLAHGLICPMCHWALVENREIQENTRKYKGNKYIYMYIYVYIYILIILIN